MHMFRVDTEIPKHECIDVTKQDEDHWKYIADQEALLTLEKELQSYASKWKYCFFFFPFYACNENKQLFILLLLDLTDIGAYVIED